MRRLEAAEVEQVLTLHKYLDRHDELLKASRAQYASYSSEIEDLPFQKELVTEALSHGRSWTAELATGIGKTVISARIALERVKDGPAVYVCPNRTAVGDQTMGIINKFVRTFSTFGRGRKLLVGQVNELSRANDVSFVTPYALGRMLRDDGPRTRSFLERASCLMVDEAHHFPDDEDEDLRVYGSIYEAADELVRDGLTVAMSGTWERLDGLHVMGRERPDRVLTVQDSIDLGRCPEVYGVQVITEVKVKKARSYGDVYDLHLSRRERARYLRGVAVSMLETKRRTQAPFAGFMRTVSDCEAVVREYNEMLKRGEKRLGMLTSQTSVPERLRTVHAIERGELAGYVTCAVGEEALDLPKLEVVHLVRRTKSIARNMQAVGRALRVHEGKRRALVVDYQTMLEGIVDRFVGVNLEDLQRRQGSRTGRVVNGGPLCTQQSYDGQLVGITTGEERALVCVRTESSVEKAKRELVEWARSGKRRPRYTNKHNRTVPREEHLLARKLEHYIKPTDEAFDPAFRATIEELAPDWLRRNDADGKKELLIKMARSGAPKPKRKSATHTLAISLYNYTHKNVRVYDAEFTATIAKLRPEWVDAQRSINKTKDALWSLAIKRKPRPSSTSNLGKSLSRLLRLHDFKKETRDFVAKLKARRPDWFEPPSAAKKRYLLRRARAGGNKPCAAWPTERKLWQSLYNYTRPGSGTYDQDFDREIRKARPDWFNG